MSTLNSETFLLNFYVTFAIYHDEGDFYVTNDINGRAGSMAEMD